MQFHYDVFATFNVKINQIETKQNKKPMLSSRYSLLLLHDNSDEKRDFE